MSTRPSPLTDLFPGFKERTKHARPVLISWRHLQVLKLLGKGLERKEVAHQLGYPNGTINTDIDRIHLKFLRAGMPMHNAIQTFNSAKKLGLIPFEPTQE